MIIEDNIKYKNNGLMIHGDVSIGTAWGGSALNKTMVWECPSAIGKGFYDIGYLGCGTFINIGKVQDESTADYIDVSSIGRFCSIASNVRIGFPEHSISFISSHPMFRYSGNSDWLDDYFPKLHDEWENEMQKKNLESYEDRRVLSSIGNDVWIGYGVRIKNGVNIGDGAVIGLGSVVTKDVEPYTVVGGNPAKVIKKRFEDAVVERLLEIKWWNYGAEILRGLDISRPANILDELDERIKQAEPYSPGYYEINTEVESIIYTERDIIGGINK